MNNVSNDSSRALIILGVLLAIGMSLAAYLLGTQAKQIGGSKQTVAVKGLAEKAVKADLAEWTVGSSARGTTFAEALGKLRAAQPKLRQFLQAQGFDAGSVADSPEVISDHYEEVEGRDGQMRNVKRGYDASQKLVVTSADLPRIADAFKAIVQFQADGNAVSYEPPLYLVRNLEEIKMSLIGAATQNAKARADEFTKNGGGKTGPMRSASQGAFYIVPAGASVDVGDYGYGGTYDKTTVDKIARVVVTIEYGIEH
jgi:uncharacterized protein